MKVLKYLLLIIALIVIGGAVFFSTKDGKFQVEESLVIDAPDELIFNTVNEFKTWEKWGPWMDNSDDLIISYPSQTSGQGAFYSWKSEIQGDGNIKTMATHPFTSIDQKITFYPPIVGETSSDVYWKFEKIEPKKTKVTWGMKGEQGLMEKIFWMTQDSTLSQNLRPMYKEGLEKLDENVKTQMQAFTINVDGKTEHGGGFYMYSATASAISAIPQKTGEMLPAVQAYISNNKLPQTGMPFTIFNEFNEEQSTAIYSVGIPVREKVTTPENSNVLCDFLPRQIAIKTTLKGDYTNLKAAWDTALKYIAENGYDIDDQVPPFEVYKIGPRLQPNPAEWVTEIYIPIKEEKENIQ